MNPLDWNGHVPDDQAPAVDPIVQLAEIRGYLRCLAEYSAADLERLRQMRREANAAPPPAPAPAPVVGYPRWLSLAIIVACVVAWVLAGLVAAGAL